MTESNPGDARINLDDYLLDPEDFETYINPKLLGSTAVHEHQWEYCLSFPQVRCMVRRPIGVEVSFINEKFEEVTQKLFDFRARVFMHELDHLNGRSMMHWKLSEGNIDILPSDPALSAEDENPHLTSTVKFYKMKIDSL